jgi:hypothetical protein
MNPFTIEYVKSEVSRREEGFRRAEKNGTVYEYPRRQFRLRWPWSFSAPKPTRVSHGGRHAPAQ